MWKVLNEIDKALVCFLSVLGGIIVAVALITVVSTIVNVVVRFVVRAAYALYN